MFCEVLMLLKLFSMVDVVSLFEIVLPQLGHILCIPAVGFDVIGERSVDVFHGQDLVSCERTTNSIFYKLA